MTQIPISRLQSRYPAQWTIDGEAKNVHVLREHLTREEHSQHRAVTTESGSKVSSCQCFESRAGWDIISETGGTMWRVRALHGGDPPKAN